WGVLHLRGIVRRSALWRNESQGQECNRPFPRRLNSQSFVMLQNPTPNQGSGFRGIVLSPQGIGHPRKAINCESLRRQQDHRDLNDDEFFGLGDDAERHDESGSSGRWMAYPEQRHERSGSRQRKRGGQDSG